jgi:NADH:ubiquinone oxidoreductase 24 kD subunit
MVKLSQSMSDIERVNELCVKCNCNPSNLIAIMQEIQSEYKYLSEEVLTLIAAKLNISLAKVYSVATFYENFSLEAKGKHIIKLCTGTACHVRKSQPIYDSIFAYLGLDEKHKTTKDCLFTLETVACLGACGLAPVMMIDGEVHAKMTPETALELLKDIQKKEAAK